MDDLRKKINECMGRDRALFQRRLKGLSRRKNQGQPYERGLADLTRQLEQSCQLRAMRASHKLDLTVPDELPIADREQEICDAIKKHQVVVVAGETGSGKTTQLPKLCLKAGRGVDGWIGCTQPRRIAARSMAARLCEELGVTLGEAVGYEVRFDQKVKPQSLIKLMTDGILLSETQSDRDLQAYDTLIIDEAHERSLNIDFILGYLKQLLPKRPDLKVVITSATIDTERFASHFNAPVIEVSGRTYPVEMRYRALQSEDGSTAKDLATGIIDAIGELNRIDGMGDVLVFLAGERDIHDVADALNAKAFRNTEVLPLYARLSASQQNRVFHPGSKRRIILATNVAETSLTVPRIRFVVDSGLARISRYSHRSKVQRLPIESVSQASANQRAGRCGRLGPGVCIRLYSEEDWEQRDEYTPPEIIRTNLASVILRMESLRLGTLEEFPFIDAPERSLIRDGYQLLVELGALDQKHQLTTIGRELNKWPLDVRLARMLVESRRLNCVEAIATVAAVLSIQDPRERPPDAMQKADTAHEQWADKRSDFVSLLNLWQQIVQTRKESSNRQFRDWCDRNFLHRLRVREWSDIRRQLLDTAKEMGWPVKPHDVDYGSLHQAVLPALLGQVGQKDEKGYLGARGRRFDIFPGSNLFGRKPAWLVSAFLVETARVYARTNAAVEPEWLEAAADHLLKRHYFDPFWSKRHGRVMGFEQVTLYGLALVEKRQIHFGPHQPEEARRILIREGLVEGQVSFKADFLTHNQRLQQEIEDLERRQRRRDLLADETQRFDFFDQRVPDHVITIKSFNRWREQAEKQDAKILFYRKEDLLISDAAQVPVLYPDHLDIGGTRVELRYRLQPGHAHDGVSVRLPLHLLNTIKPPPLEWLVPGLLQEKIVALVKSLPKSQRRLFVPVPEVVDEFLAIQHDKTGSLHNVLAEFLSQRASISIDAAAFDLGRLSPHLLFNIQLYDDQALVDSGRDLVDLQLRYGEDARQDFIEKAADQMHADGRRQWDFGAVPESVTLDGGVEAYPAVVDQEDSVGIRLFDTRQEAADYHLYGLHRLCELTLGEKFRFLRHRSPVSQKMGLQYQPVDRFDTLKDDLTVSAGLSLIRRFAEPVRDRESFQRLAEQVRQQLLSVANEIADPLKETLSSFYRVRQKLAERDFGALFPWAEEDITQQLDYLIYPGFLTETDVERIVHYPRYLSAIEQRLDDLEYDPQRDQQRQESVAGFWNDYLQRSDQVNQPLERFRWLIEEYRVSVFAQKLKTAEPVSAKRLSRALKDVLDNEI